PHPLARNSAHPHRYTPPSPTRRSSDLQVLRARRDFQIRQLLDGPAVGEVVVHRADIVQAVRVGDELMVGAVLRQLLHAPVQKPQDRKSTRLNSSHEWISYAVFCLKKKT